MKVQFSRDFGDFKTGTVYDLTEDEADFHREAGRAFIPAEPKPEAKPEPEPAPKPEKLPKKPKGNK